MATESKIEKIVLHSEQYPPKGKSFLVGIPMYMYRIKTQDFQGGLDFFQHTILRFKERGDVSVKEIIHYTGFDNELVEEVCESLKRQNLIDNMGAITIDGKYALAHPYETIINTREKSKKLGYVFKLKSNTNDYSIYQEQISPVIIVSRPNETLSIAEENINGEDIKLDILEITVPQHKTERPQVGEILELIDNYTQPIAENGDSIPIEENNQRERQLSVQFIPDERPIEAIVCTYVYLPALDKNTYASDWVVMDPFNSQLTSPALKFYLEGLKDESFLSKIEEQFMSATTIESLSLKQLFEKDMQDISEEIQLLWGDKFEQLDSNLKKYIYIIFQKNKDFARYEFQSIDASQSLVLYIQASLETLLIIDKKSHDSKYKFLEASYTADDTYKLMRSVFKENNVFYPNELKSLVKIYKKLMDNHRNPSSLREYIPAFILTNKGISNNALFNTFINKLDIILRLADNRNSQSHGHDSSDGEIIILSKNDTMLYFKTFTDIISDYLK